jgi:cytochrome c oxidase subunit III
MSEHSSSVVAEQFEDAAQQYEAATLGMWCFLATEILFFGGLFMAYLTYRHAYPAAFALASKHTIVSYGTINTAILLTSSLTMALAVHAAQVSRTRALVRNLLLTVGLALGFLVVKAFEYHEDFVEHLVPGPSFPPTLPPQAQIFFYLYWAMTGLHACHVLVGVGVLSVIAGLAWRGRYSSAYHTPVELSGLYWHFVDLVWIFLYPLLYLIDRHL